MSDQLQQAIDITKSKIAALEDELRREKDFLTRLIPGGGHIPKRSRSNSQNWLTVFAEIAEKPRKHEHVIDVIEANDLPMTRGATRVWLNSKVKAGHLKRSADGLYTATASGKDWLKASLPTS